MTPADKNQNRPGADIESSGEVINPEPPDSVAAEHEQGSGESRPSDENRSPEEIRADIERTREDLGDTAAALAEKADVKGQAKAKVEDVKHVLESKKDEATARAKDMGRKAREAAPESVGEGAHSAMTHAQENPVPVGLVAAFLGGLMVGWILAR